jgi:uncharacterized protein (DUF488 family)
MRNVSFRAYADHMETDRFKLALDELVADARSHRSVVMCAETLWWRCHRRLIADALVLTRGCDLRHLFPNGTLVEHVVTDGARVEGGDVIYDVVSP